MLCFMSSCVACSQASEAVSLAKRALSHANDRRSRLAGSRANEQHLQQQLRDLTERIEKLEAR